MAPYRAKVCRPVAGLMSKPDNAKLKRSLSLLDVMALGVNAVIGQGIFLLPGLAAAILGPASLVGLLCAAGIALLIALCFAEVATRFDTTGGAYVYARETFGPFVGFEVGWMLCCVGIISWAALANGFTVVLARFIPAVGSGWLQPVVAIGLMAVLGAVNMWGAKLGATLSTFFSIAKLVPVIVFVAVGLLHIEGANYEPFSPQGYDRLAEGTMLMLYAFVGFESSVVPAGEMKNPKRAVPIALVTVMALVCVAYLAVFVVTIGTFPAVAGHGNPVAAASEGFLGPIGGTLIAAGIVVSVFGINTGAALVSPRKLYALAESGDLPKPLARVDPKTGTPRTAIMVTLVVAAVLSLTGSVKDLAILGVVARFVQYIPTCIAVIVLRRREGAEATKGFRVPFGPVIPIAAVGLCLWLLAYTEPSKLLFGAIALVAGVPIYLLGQRARRQDPSAAR
jgi:amino acid transporter